MNNNFLRLMATAALGLGLGACQSPSSSKTETAETTGAAASASVLTPGPWRGVLAAQGQEIPFLFEVKTEAGKPVVYLINKGLDGEERLRCEEISTAGDSTTIRMHAFDAALVVRADGKDKLKGMWVKYDAKTPYRVPLTATAGEQPLFPDVQKPAANSKQMQAETTYTTEFKDSEGGAYPAVAVIRRSGKTGAITGTFLTSTGDYRYLAGQGDDKQLRLSTFVVSLAFLFTAQNGPKEPIDITKEYAPNTLFGDFYSGKSGHETWTAVPDPNAKLPDADRLAAMKPGQKRLDFKFPSIVEGASISPTDAKYKGKVVVVQVLGSWCPNCMDETNFLAPWYEKNKARGVEIIGLGYERTADYQLAAAKLRKMKDRLHMGYDVAVAGQASAAEASKSLPQLDKVLAFPTTIFIDKKGEVRKIHTGFSGPGTGKYYADETAGFEQTINQLLKE